MGLSGIHPLCHACENRHPVFFLSWFPASAGKTKEGQGRRKRNWIPARAALARNDDTAVVFNLELLLPFILLYAYL